jgi:hypothetical protein
MNSQEREIQDILASNIDKIIASYKKNNDLKNLLEYI